MMAKHCLLVLYTGILLQSKCVCGAAVLGLLFKQPVPLLLLLTVLLLLQPVLPMPQLVLQLPLLALIVLMTDTLAPKILILH
jgi:hypothetical protein